MPDPRVGIVRFEDPIANTLDWLILPNGMLDETQALATAITIALGTDARANADDPLPDPDSTDLRGWWGDDQAQQIWNGWPIGSRLWLYQRAKLTDAAARKGATVAQIDRDIRVCLQPFVTNRIVSGFTVSVVRTGVNNVEATILVYRAAQPTIELRYQTLWDEIG
jgi:phage gp46-like protein